MLGSGVDSCVQKGYILDVLSLFLSPPNAKVVADTYKAIIIRIKVTSMLWLFNTVHFLKNACPTLKY